MPKCSSGSSSARSTTNCASCWMMLGATPIADVLNALRPLVHQCGAQPRVGPTNTLAAVSAAMATEGSALVAESDDQMLGRIGYRETAEDPYGRRLRVFRECHDRAASVPRRVLNG